MHGETCVADCASNGKQYRVISKVLSGPDFQAISSNVDVFEVSSLDLRS